MTMIMDSLLSILFFVFTLFSFNPLFSFASKPSYKDHCALIIPESTAPIATTSLRHNPFPLVGHHTGYYTGGDSIINVGASWNRFSFYFPARNTRATQHDPHLFKMEGTISFKSTNMPQNSYLRGHVTFKLDGFWSESSGKVCMVGTGSGYYSKKGNSLNLDAVFKLDNVFNASNITTSLVIGSLESLSSEKDENFFEPISVMMFPKANYNYTLGSIEVEHEFSSGSSDDAIADEQGLPLNFDSLSFCKSPLSWAIGRLQLEYSQECNSSSKDCTPILSGSPGQFPSLMSLKGLECSQTKKHRMRVLVEFSNIDYYWVNQSFNTKTMLIGEGWWDEKKNMLCVVACHMMGTNTSSSLAGTHVGDCSLRLRLRFPSVWSIKNTSSIVGQIWSNKTANDPGYFKMITFRNDEDRGVGGQGLKYEYSQLDKVNESCPKHNHVEKQGKRYPDAYSYDMRFDMSVRESNKRVAWGYSSPLSVDDQFYELDLPTSSDSFSSSSREFLAEILNNNNGGLFNISYKISISVMSYSPFDRSSLFNKSYSVKISAEGIYDSRAGTLCMIGCRDLVSNNGKPTTTDSMDCDILVKFQFPSLDTKDRSYIKGSIESTREKSDPLYFKRLELSTVAYYIEAARKNVWRMDMEVMMAMISTTLACAFVGLQLYHVKKHPHVLPFISLVMMSILTLGHMIPLVLNFEALLTQNPNNRNFVLGNAGWLEVNEVSVRLITMVAFLLQFRLLYLTWSSRKTNESNNGLWGAEKKAAYITFSLYAVGLLIALLLKLKSDGDKVTPVYQQHHSSWENIKSFGGLVLDGFLLPQVILNQFSNMKESVLCCSFYFGTTFVRLLPHAYDLYRTHSYAGQDDGGSYFYADPSEDFYSTAWDIVIPLGGFLLAIITYLQQCFGSHCILPCGFKRSKVYEKVPVVGEAEIETTNM